MPGSTSRWGYANLGRRVAIADGGRPAIPGLREGQRRTGMIGERPGNELLCLHHPAGPDHCQEFVVEGAAASQVIGA